MKTSSYILLAGMIGIGTSITAIAMLMFGVGQFNILKLVSGERGVEVFGICSGIVSLSAVLLEPLGGFIVDRYVLFLNHRSVYIALGSFFGFLCMVIFAYVPNIILLVIAWIAIRFFYGLVSTACNLNIIDEIDQSKIGRAYGYIGASVPITIMLSSVVIMGLYAHSPVDEKILMLGGLQLIGGILSIIFFGKKGVNNNYAKIKTEASFRLMTYPNIKTYPEYTLALLSKMLIDSTYAGLSMTSFFLIYRFKFNEGEVFKFGSITFLGLILMVLFGIAVGFFSDKIKKQNVFIILSSLLMGGCMFAYAFSHNVNYIIMSSFVFNGCIGVFGTISSTITYRILPSRETYGKDLAIIKGASGLSSSLIVFIAPFVVSLSDRYFKLDGYEVLFSMLGVFSLLSGALIAFIPDVGFPLKRDAVKSGGIGDKTNK